VAQIYPFQPLRYTGKAGPLDNLVTQPYDKISSAMQARYLALSPYNIVRVVLGEREPESSTDNVYTRARGYLHDWIHTGILARDPEPGIFPYFQEFTVPDTGERLVRKSFIALGAVEDYSAGIVYPHEKTLSGPKKDRMELLRSTRAQFEQIFMLYADPACTIDTLLDEAAAGTPLAQVTDEYGVIHRMWRIAGGEQIQNLMRSQKLLIADGHHRYETAIAFRDANPEVRGAGFVPMALVNMHSPGLKILATHRLVSGISPDGFVEAATGKFRVEQIDSLDRLQRAWENARDHAIIGAAIGAKLYMLEDRTARGELDVRVLHERVLEGVLGISEQAVRDEKHLRYIRGLDAAVQEVRKGTAQIAFLLKPTSVEQVAATSFGGGVMPQKSTDFYPKLLSGLAIYQIE
jgi:uncharacterized protein (DUF1015 family)